MYELHRKESNLMKKRIIALFFALLVGMSSVMMFSACEPSSTNNDGNSENSENSGNSGNGGDGEGYRGEL
jgi:hypothetical protein